MSNAIDNVRQGRRTYTASGALSDGMLVVPNSTAGQVVAAPATGPVSMVCVTNAATTEDVEIVPVIRGAEYRAPRSDVLKKPLRLAVSSASSPTNRRKTLTERQS